jgi:hypothetical protein
MIVLYALFAALFVGSIVVCGYAHYWHLKTGGDTK